MGVIPHGDRMSSLVLESLSMYTASGALSRPFNLLPMLDPAYPACYNLEHTLETGLTMHLVMTGALSHLNVPNIPLIFRACRRSAIPSRRPKRLLRRSLDAAYNWICAAQDATPDGGVAGWYSSIKGWSASYPETTGYIIPTFLTCSRVVSKPEARERAIRMADWEIEVQLPSGAARSGVMGARVGPAVFNTGQVLFGWIAAFQATGEERYAKTAQRAAEWLIQNQDDDGAWRKNLSLLTTSTVQTYNVRAAWGLLLAGQALDEAKWIKAARSNCDWALGQQQENGWFAHCGFYKNEVPLLHTIGYVLEGLLGVGESLGDEKYIDAARVGIKVLADIYQRQGTLKGRYNSNWDNTVSWRCLTGEAQIALVLYRFSKCSNEDEAFAQMGLALLEGLAAIQDTESPFPESNGGIGGSEPIWRGYFPFSYINWAAKFYLDALLLELFRADAKDFSGGGG